MRVPYALIEVARYFLRGLVLSLGCGVGFPLGVKFAFLLVGA
ncbi:hypothetical protein [Polaromonas sp.]|nr:hypothetical protein [Polaromonas sp.]MDP1740095.1 hypothetical protein [Polaromonas sp.]